MFMVGRLITLLAGRAVMVDGSPASIEDGTGLAAGVLVIDDEAALPDLPCPWCLAPTDESDVSCPSCGQDFGPFSPPRTLG